VSTVLLIDSEAHFRNVLRRYLEVKGYAVLTADGAAEALAQLEAVPDAVIADASVRGDDQNPLWGAIRTRCPDAALIGTQSEAARVVGADDAPTEFGLAALLAKPLRFDAVLGALASAGVAAAPQSRTPPATPAQSPTPRAGAPSGITPSGEHPALPRLPPLPRLPSRTSLSPASVPPPPVGPAAAPLLEPPPRAASTGSGAYPAGTPSGSFRAASVEIEPSEPGFHAGSPATTGRRAVVAEVEVVPAAGHADVDARRDLLDAAASIEQSLFEEDSLAGYDDGLDPAASASIEVARRDDLADALAAAVQAGTAPPSGGSEPTTAARRTGGTDVLSGDGLESGDRFPRGVLTPMKAHGPSDPNGIYGELTMPELVFRVFRDLFSGRITLRRGEVTKDIFVVNGRPINAQSNVREENLGHRLLAQGLITADQHRRSVELMLEQEIQQGEALQQMGLLTAVDLFDHLRRQARERILNCFSWTDAEYGLQYEPDVAESMTAFEMNPLRLVFEGVERAYPLAPLLAHFDDYASRVVWRTPRYADYATMLRPFAEWLKIAFLCDGARTLGEILALSNVGMIEALRTIRALEIVGCVEFGPVQQFSDNFGHADEFVSTSQRIGGSLSGETSPTPKPDGRPITGSHRRFERQSSGPVGVQPVLGAQQTEIGAPHPATAERLERLRSFVMETYLRVSKANYYEALEVTVEARTPDIVSAYDRFEKSLGAEGLDGVEDGLLRNKARDALIKLRKARDVLLDPKRRAEYDRKVLKKKPAKRVRPDILKAEINYREGRKALDERDFERAFELLDLAVQQDPHQTVYRMYRGWAHFQCADDREGRAEAQDEIKAALVDDRSKDVGYILLGHICRERGDDATAERLYRKALDVNPRNAEARRYLQVLRPSTGEKEDGDKKTDTFFGRLFK
jgi:CheY-like chemotaxis protein/Flp pilus assembly protein TadD